VIRPKWTPNDLQRRLADTVETEFRDVDQREAHAWKTLADARDAGVPITHLVERSRRPRPTLYRRLDELGLGNPDNKTWTLAITGNATIADLRRVMADDGIKGKPVKVENGVALSLVGETGKEQLEFIRDQFVENNKCVIS
jgi:hypothetical protein